MHRAGFARYAARLYPTATEVDLRIIAALFTWFFLVDDLCDGPHQPTGGPAPTADFSTPTGGPAPTVDFSTPTGGPAVLPGTPSTATDEPAAPAGAPLTAQQVGALREATLRLLRGGDEPGHRALGPATAGAGRTGPPGLTGPLRRMLVEAWRVPRRRMPERWRVRFTDAVAHHLDGVRQQAANRAAGREPTRAEYLPLRRATSAAYVSYTLIEFATGRILPDAVYHHPLLVRIAGTANDLLSWFNDVVSLDRDLVGSGGHNLVLVTAREHGVPPEAAVGLVVAQWQAAMARFGELCAAVPSFGPGLDEAVAVHLDGFANSIRGTIDWSYESARYPV